MVHNKENAVSWDEDGEDAVLTDNLTKYEASEMLIIINSSTPNLYVLLFNAFNTIDVYFLNKSLHG